MLTKIDIKLVGDNNAEWDLWNLWCLHVVAPVGIYLLSLSNLRAPIPLNHTGEKCTMHTFQLVHTT